MKEKIEKLLLEKQLERSLLKPRLSLLESQIDVLDVINDRWDSDLSVEDRKNATTTLKELFGLQDEKPS